MSLSEFVDAFELSGEGAVLSAEELRFGSLSVPIRNGIPRFTPDVSYSTGNFSLLRDKHSLLQFDSRNGTSDRRDTILRRTNWAPEFFSGKRVLECGCGAGPDSEILRQLGASVVSVDIAGVDVAQRNVGELGHGCFVQADITRLPFKPGHFDIVYCHRVLQHTPEPRKTLDHILRFVRPDGAAFVHSYARTAYQMFRWKYALRPVTKRMDAEKLYRRIEAAGPFLFGLTNALYRVPGGRLFSHFFIPFLNYSGAAKFARLSPGALLEYAVHDTFDALSPRYDSPISASEMRNIASRYLQRPFEVAEDPTITLLRSKL